MISSVGRQPPVLNTSRLRRISGWFLCSSSSNGWHTLGIWWFVTLLERNSNVGWELKTYWGWTSPHGAPSSHTNPFRSCKTGFSRRISLWSRSWKRCWTSLKSWSESLALMYIDCSSLGSQKNRKIYQSRFFLERAGHLFHLLLHAALQDLQDSGC
jgi:hypothetical protein